MDETCSQAERFARDPARRGRLMKVLSDKALTALETQWAWWERPGQRPPPGDWQVWLVMAGRGFGKTRIGAEWVRAAAEARPKLRVALVGATRDDVRRVMIEGDSGLLAIAPRPLRPQWEPSLGRLTWPNGSVAHAYSAAEPEGLRGPQHHIAWADEIAKWAQGIETWDNLMLTLRAGAVPRVVATTTPRPVALVRRLVAEGVAVTRGATSANRAHLSPHFLATATQLYAGTRLGRQELDGELIEDVENALWNRALIEKRRVRAAPELVRVVIGVDPPGGSERGEGGDACGIVAVALGRDGHGYVIEDASVRGASPAAWAQAVAACAARHRADLVVAEKNQGGSMVKTTLQAAEAGLPVRLVHASIGKSARAEPVSLLYESGKVWHAGAFPALEDELCGLVTGGGYDGPGRSPDRADACVWALSALMLNARGGARVRAL